MKENYKESIIAKNGSTIKNAKINKVYHMKHIVSSGLIGFLLGIIASVIGSYLWEIIKLSST